MNAVNHIPLINISKTQTGCCPLIDPAEWNEQTFVFKNKPFVKVKTHSFLHVPLNMGSVMKHAQEKIDEAGASLKEYLILSHEASTWHADHYLAVSKDVPGLENTTLSGTFVTRVFEGPYKDAPKWYGKLIQYARSINQKPLKTFFFYTTCPKCSKAYGKNYVVGFEQIAEKQVIT